MLQNGIGFFKNEMAEQELPSYDSSGQETPTIEQVLEPFPPSNLFESSPYKIKQVSVGRWDIPHFSKLPEKEYGPTFSCGGATWYIIYRILI
jgi:hypothetical protein